MIGAIAHDLTFTHSDGLPFAHYLTDIGQMGTASLPNSVISNYGGNHQMDAKLKLTFRFGGSASDCCLPDAGNRAIVQQPIRYSG